jgi:hypothetical protein
MASSYISSYISVRPPVNCYTLAMLQGAIGFDFSTQFMKTLQVIYPQPHRYAMFMHQLFSQAPAHAYVAKIIDGHAKNIAA